MSRGEVEPKLGSRHLPGRRIDMGGRVFFVKEGPTGAVIVNERLIWKPGTPYASTFMRVRYHSGKGRKPSKDCVRVLALLPPEGK